MQQLCRTGGLLHYLVRVLWRTGRGGRSKTGENKLLVYRRDGSQAEPGLLGANQPFRGFLCNLQNLRPVAHLLQSSHNVVTHRHNETQFPTVNRRYFQQLSKTVRYSQHLPLPTREASGSLSLHQALKAAKTVHYGPR